MFEFWNGTAIDYMIAIGIFAPLMAYLLTCAYVLIFFKDINIKYSTLFMDIGMVPILLCILIMMMDNYRDELGEMSIKEITTIIMLWYIFISLHYHGTTRYFYKK